MYVLMSFDSKDAWRVYPNKSGVHSNIRRQLQQRHQSQYKNTVHNENLKDNTQKAIKNHNAIRLPLTQDSICHHLVEWITATDQVCHYIYLCCAQIEVSVSKPLRATEHPSFQKLLLHISESLTEDDIPYCTALTEAMKEAVDDILCRHRLEMQVSAVPFAQVDLMTSG